MATLTYMPTEHVPVLASELIDRSRSRSRPDRRRLHLRRRWPCAAGGRAPGPLGHAGVHRPRPRGGGALRRARRRGRLRAALRPRRLRRGLDACCAPRALVADLAYMDLGISSLQLDAAERGFSYTYDAPARHAYGPRAGALGRNRRQRMAGGSARRGDPRVRGGASRALDRRRDRAPASARDHGGARRGDQGGRAARVSLRARSSGQADLPGDPDRRQRRARPARPGAPRAPGTCCATGAVWRPSRSTPSRTAG